MTLKQIETFRWIVRLGGFAAAAERMYSTQSAVSIRIKELEQTLGVKLFDRSHRTPHLTAKGEEFLSLTEELMHIIWQMRASVADPHGLEGFARIGVADLIAITWLTELISTARELYPNVTLDLEIGLTKDLLEKLRHSELDLILVPSEGKTSEFNSHSLGRVTFDWVASPKLGLPEKCLTAAELNNLPIITLSRNSVHYQIIERWFKANGSRCHRVIVCNSIHVMRTLTTGGLGLGFLPLSVINEEIKKRQLMVLDTNFEVAPIEFFSMTAADHETPLVSLLESLAVETSTFSRK